MNYRERFLEIKNFLKHYQNIWQNEIMLDYPEPLKHYPHDWLEELGQFQDKNDLIQIEKKDVLSFINNPSLRIFYQTIARLSDLPHKESSPPIQENHWTWLYMIPKKQHEIRLLAPHVNNLYLEQAIDQVIDVGGGIGLLAQTLNNTYGHKVISIDKDLSLQQTGILRHQKNSRYPSNKVTYKNMLVAPTQEFKDVIVNNSLIIGLHTCGKLALDLMNTSCYSKSKVVINFGCCYHTLNESDDCQNISQFAKNHDPLWMNKFSLTLACRAHKKLTQKDFDLKQKVKYFRYAFHILLWDKLGIQERVTLGNSHPKLYDLTFAEYASEQLKRLDINSHFSSDFFQDFYHDPSLQELIKNMLTAGIIRNALGRLLELYLLLDRAIFLEENGYEVEVSTFFDEEISPRNIGITAILKHTQEN